jgi:hypothetical protein
LITAFLAKLERGDFPQENVEAVIKLKSKFEGTSGEFKMRASIV